VSFWVGDIDLGPSLQVLEELVELENAGFDKTLAYMIVQEEGNEMPKGSGSCSSWRGPSEQGHGLEATERNSRFGREATLCMERSGLRPGARGPDQLTPRLSANPDHDCNPPRVFTGRRR
jgi:hypothetical protein